MSPVMTRQQVCHRYVIRRGEKEMQGDAKGRRIMFVYWSSAMAQLTHVQQLTHHTLCQLCKAF